MSKLEVISFNKQIFHAVSLSGGKDSTAMLLLMIERDLPINTVLWADTGMEFPEMYDHISKVDDYLYRERGIHITMLRHPKGFEYLMFEEEKQRPSSMLRCTPVKGDYQFYIYCYQRKPFEKAQKEQQKNDRLAAKKRAEPER